MRTALSSIAAVPDRIGRRFIGVRSVDGGFQVRGGVDVGYGYLGRMEGWLLDDAQSGGGEDERR